MNRDAGRMPTVNDAVLVSALGAVSFISGLVMVAVSLTFDGSHPGVQLDPMVGAAFMLLGLIAGTIGFLVVLGLSGGPEP